MTILRRKFLSDASRSAFAAGLLLAGARVGLGQMNTRSDIPAEAQRDPVLLFTAATFTPYVGDIFQVSTPVVKASNYAWTAWSNMQLKTA